MYCSRRTVWISVRLSGRAPSGSDLLGVTFWDYSAMPLHIGKYINLPFCLVWGGIGVAWVWKIYPLIRRKLETPVLTGPNTAMRVFLVFMVCSQVLTGAALLRMHERQSRNVEEMLWNMCWINASLTRHCNDIFRKWRAQLQVKKYIYRKEKAKTPSISVGFFDREEKGERMDMEHVRSNICTDFRPYPIYFCRKICYNVRKGKGCNGREGFYLNGF